MDSGTRGRRWLPARYLLSYEPRRPVWFRTLELASVGLAPVLFVWGVFLKSRWNRSRRLQRELAAMVSSSSSSPVRSPAAAPLTPPVSAHAAARVVATCPDYHVVVGAPAVEKQFSGSAGEALLPSKQDPQTPQLQ